MEKEMRNAIYKIALEAITERMSTGLCWALEIGLNAVINNIEKTKRYDDNLLPDEYSPFGYSNSNPEKVYPEIFKYKPENANAFWFPKTNRQIRINILRKAIKETNS